jgi:tetratricopeptide (TPR) repeat protein
MENQRHSSPRAPADPDGLESFGFNQADDSWMERIREAEAPLPFGFIGRYELQEEASRGGQGVVYRAVEKGRDRPVALKRLLGGSFATASMRRRFEREMEALNALEHPNIVSAFAMDIVDGAPVLAMEWITGVPITRWAAGNGARRRPREFVDTMLTVCEAVNHAHQRGIMHRDLKPSNILIDTGGTPHVLDFGLAKLVDPAGSADQYSTLTDQFVGTLAYASPEQLRGRPNELDVRSDVYSLGVILYEMLTGRIPYELGETIATAAQAIENSEPIRPSTIGESVDEDLEAITLKALAKDKAARYQSVEALAADLRGYLAGEAISASVPSGLSHLIRTLRQHLLAVTFAAIVFVLVTVFAAVAATLAVRLAQQRDLAVSARTSEAEARGRAEQEAAKAQAVSAFLQDMLAAVDPMRDNTRDITVHEVLDAAAARIEADFAGQSDLEAALCQVIGVTYHSLGRYDDAEPQLLRALEIRESFHQGDHADLADVMNELGHLKTSKGRYAEAEQLLREGLRMRRALLGDEHADVATSLNNLGKVMIRRGAGAEAESPFREALAIRRKVLGGEHELTVSSLGNLAACLHSQGKYEQAETLYRQALDLERRIQSIDDLDQAWHLHNLGALLRDTGRYDEAEALFRQSLELKREALGEYHPTVGFTLNALGKLLYLAGRHGQAEAILLQALAVYARTMDDQHPRIAEALTNLAELYDAWGKPAEADACRARLGDLSVPASE